MHFERSRELFERARQVIPGGIYGHATPALVAAGASPYYAHRAEGARYWDVDGNEFIDLMCAYGPVVLGYRHAGVEAAAQRQSALGDCLNHPGAVMIELAERLVSLVDFAAWAVFGKNGSDMSTWCVRVAREHTRRKKILCIEGAYHGIGGWCTPGHGGLIEEDRAHVHRFRWNDGASFDAAMARYGNQVAAVVVTPYHHPLFAPSELPASGFLAHVQSQCARHGVVLVLDDIRAGFRLHMGGSHRYFGFEPDLICFSKAMANGYPIAAALGKTHLRRAAEKVFLTGSYWNSAVPMAAALETLATLEREGASRTSRVWEVRLRRVSGWRPGARGSKSKFPDRPPAPSSPSATSAISIGTSTLRWSACAAVCFSIRTTTGSSAPRSLPPTSTGYSRSPLLPSNALPARPTGRPTRRSSSAAAD